MLWSAFYERNNHLNEYIFQYFIEKSFIENKNGVNIKDVT